MPPCAAFFLPLINPMSIGIEKMRVHQAQAIQRLSIQLGYACSLEETQNNIQSITASKNDCAFVAVTANEIIAWVHGFVTYRIESNPFVEIAGLVVDENFRGKGVGKALVNRVKEWSIEAGVATLRLRSNVKRKEAHRFYEHIGFTVTK